jgi:hypothetical protein
MSMLKKNATSVQEFIQIVSDLEAKKKWSLWFRGHANSEWKLIPRLYRGLEPGSNVREEDDDAREHFIRSAGSLSDVRPADKWDWYFIMQHHGAPTRLLDWTESALIAIFFAVRESDGFHDATVWALDPWELNKKVVRKKEVLPPGEPGITREDRNRYDRWLRERFAKRQHWPRRPVAVYPRHSTRRIAAQQSCFTVHGSDRRGLEKIVPQLGLPLVEITIPSWAVGSVQRCLKTCGVDETMIFPDLDGLGRSFAPDDKKAEEGRSHVGVFAKLGPSRIDKVGVGVFAIKNIKKGTPLFGGDLDEMLWLEKSKLPRRPPAVRKLYDDFAVIETDAQGTTRYGCPTNFNRMTVAWYLNHSESPNTKCDDDLNFSALRNINRGEELTVDYSTYSERPGPWVEPWWPAKREVRASRPARVRRRRRGTAR